MSRTGIISPSMVSEFLLCVGLLAPVHAEKRVALVIGNSAYQTVPKLLNPDNDAALNEFSKQLVGADVALFYYAGHGVETHGLNYLVPIDAHPREEANVFEQ